VSDGSGFHALCARPGAGRLSVSRGLGWGGAVTFVTDLEQVSMGEEDSPVIRTSEVNTSAPRIISGASEELE